MPTVKIELSDAEYAKAIVKKAEIGKDWREILLDGIDVEAEGRRIGRPPKKHALDDLYKFNTSEPPSNSDVEDEMAAVFAPWRKKKKE